MFTTYKLLTVNGFGHSEAEWNLDVAVYPLPGKHVFDGARERRLSNATMTRKDYNDGTEKPGDKDV